MQYDALVRKIFRDHGGDTHTLPYVSHIRFESPQQCNVKFKRKANRNSPPEMTQEDRETLQNKMINEEYKIWKKNSVFLYDIMYR